MYEILQGARTKTADHIDIYWKSILCALFWFARMRMTRTGEKKGICSAAILVYERPERWVLMSNGA